MQSKNINVRMWGDRVETKTGVRTLSFLVITLAVYLLLWQGLSTYWDLPTYYYGRLIEALAMFLFLGLAVATPMDFSKMGIISSRKTLFRSLAVGFLTSFLFVFGLAVFRWFSVGNLPFSWHIQGDISRVTYFLVAPFQEVLAKSVMLYSFELVFEEKHPRLAMLLSALTFGAFHVVYGIEMMLLSMLLSLVTGVMFLRYRSVWGCAVLHFSCGFFPPCFGF